MKVALTIWEGRISPVLDVSREALVLNLVKGRVASRSTEPLGGPDPIATLRKLVELGIETLICGAVSEPLYRELTDRGMRVIGFVSGGVDEIVAAFLAGRLNDQAFVMPGCGGQRRFRHRGGKKSQP